MAGNINRPSLTDLNFDFQTLKLAKNLLLNKTGDSIPPCLHPVKVLKINLEPLIAADVPV